MKLPKPKKSSYSSFVTKTGALIRHLKPAAFCDTSFLLDYWSSVIHEPFLQTNPNSLSNQTEAVYIEYLKADSRTKKVFEIRKKVVNNSAKVNLVFSPACRIELEGVVTAQRFKQYGSTVTETINAIKKSNKEIGDILIKLKGDFIKLHKRKNKTLKEQGVELLFHHFFFTTNSLEEGLEGIFEVDIENFSITKRDLKDLIYLANLQVGFADIFHILTAKKLGCKYIFTLDMDFSRVKDIIMKTYKIEILTDPTKMLQVISCS